MHCCQRETTTGNPFSFVLQWNQKREPRITALLFSRFPQSTVPVSSLASHASSEPRAAKNEAARPWKEKNALLLFVEYFFERELAAYLRLLVQEFHFFNVGFLVTWQTSR